MGLKRRLGFKTGITAVMITGIALLGGCEKQQDLETSFLCTHGPIIAGEVTQTSVILQSRIAASDTLIDGDVPGFAAPPALEKTQMDDPMTDAPRMHDPGIQGIGCFELSTRKDFSDVVRTDWVRAVPEHDYIVKTKVDGLEPDTRYYYRFLWGPDNDTFGFSAGQTFRTLPEPDTAHPVSFAVVTGMNYAFFHHGAYDGGETAYKGEDKPLGYPGLKSILEKHPDYFIGTGDNVYYDHFRETSAKTPAELRRKWHEQFIQQRFWDLFAEVPTYWEKDDHDHRYNDSDTTGDTEPSNELGIEIFREQLPVTDPGDPNAVTYRTHRFGSLVQLWFTEGRDYRSPNAMSDGPSKTLWGDEQKQWLKDTLLESDAVFKILVSPTPLVGPDDAYKSDNHVNQKGFRYEGDEFFRWLKENGFIEKNFYLVCGDRHWQYHSVHPSGFEEFSCGALVDANSRLGRLPGDPESTDPDGEITQIFTQDEASGGFLLISASPGENSTAPVCRFSFYDEFGEPLYAVTKIANE